MDNKLKNVKIIILGGDNPNTLGMIRTLGEAEITFTSIIIRDLFIIASKSRYIDKKRLFIERNIDDAYRDLMAVKQQLNGEKAYLLVEGDANSGYLDRHYNELKDYFIWNNAGEEGRLSDFLKKEKQLELAIACGFNVLPSTVVNVGEIPTDIEYPVITKAITSEMSNWKAEVFVCKNEDELREAYKSLRSEKVLIQKYVYKKDELCLDGHSIDHGRKQFISIASNYNYLLESGFSYQCTVSNYDNKELIDKLTNMMSQIGYEGIYCIEFIIDQDDTPYFLEINFRNSGWSYASTCVGMPLPILWIKSMINNQIDSNDRKDVPNNYTFVQDLSDYRARVGKRISVFQWLKEYMNTDCKLELGRHDVGPMIAFIIDRFTKKMKRKMSSHMDEK